VGGHHTTEFLVDGNMTRDRFCDPDSGLSGCKDYKYIDSGEAVMIGLHGSEVGHHWEGLMRKPGSDGSCHIDAPESPGDGAGLFLGDMDAMFFHFSSCHSMDDDDMPNKWRLFEDPMDSPGNGRRLHQADGFHGMMGIGSTYDPDYLVFAMAAQFATI